MKRRRLWLPQLELVEWCLYPGPPAAPDPDRGSGGYPMKSTIRSLALGILLVGIGFLVPRALAIPPIHAPARGTLRVRIKRGEAAFNHDITLKVDHDNDGTWDESEFLGTLSEGGTHNLESTLEVDLGTRINVFCHGHNPGTGEESDTNLVQHSVAPHWTAPPNSRLKCGTEDELDITDLYNDAGYRRIAAGCWEDYPEQNHDYDDLGTVVDFVPGTMDYPVTINVRNPEGEPLSREMGGTAFDVNFFGVINMITEYWGNFSSHTQVPPLPDGRTYLGGYVEKEGFEMLMPGSSADKGGSVGDAGGWAIGQVWCSWEEDADITGGTCNVVLATRTPTRTPTASPGRGPAVADPRRRDSRHGFSAAARRPAIPGEPVAPSRGGHRSAGAAGAARTSGWTSAPRPRSARRDGGRGVGVGTAASARRTGR